MLERTKSIKAHGYKWFALSRDSMNRWQSEHNNIYLGKIPNKRLYAVAWNLPDNQGTLITVDLKAATDLYLEKVSEFRGG